MTYLSCPNKIPDITLVSSFRILPQLGVETASCSRSGRLALALWALLHAPVQAGAVAPQDLAQRLTEVRSALNVDHGRFSGAAAPVLEQAIAQAQYVMIGESHMTHEVPQFAAAVCDAMAPGGLGALAVEAGPQAAAFVAGTLGKPDRLAQMAQLTQRYPDSAAFVNLREEDDLIEHCAEADHAAPLRVWGLDQEFIGSAGWLLAKIQATAPGPQVKDAVAGLQQMERQRAANAQASGDPSPVLLLSATDDDLAPAAAALSAQGDTAAVALFEELVRSRRIYRLNQQGKPESNFDRARLLKQHLLRDVADAGGDDAAGRILFKFGGWHVYKGFNPLHQRDLGNYVAEWADAQGKTALHIAVYAAGGEHLAYAGYGRPPKTETISAVADAPWMKPLVDAQLPETWTLFDLRALRFVKFPGIDPELERLIYGYDLLVLIPAATPAHALSARALPESAK
jgi:erythromycin esterase-like protein